jgi:hypothetical protein
MRGLITQAPRQCRGVFFVGWVTPDLIRVTNLFAVFVGLRCANPTYKCSSFFVAIRCDMDSGIASRSKMGPSKLGILPAWRRR